VRWLRDLFRTRVHGHVCEVRGMMVTLRALCEYVGNEVPRHASVSQCQVAIMEAHDEMRSRAEEAAADLRALMAVELGAEPPATMRVTAEMIMRQRLRTKAAQG
jgi:hypothetical protein